MKVEVTNVDSLHGIRLMCNADQAISLRDFLDFYERVGMVDLKDFRVKHQEHTGLCYVSVSMMEPRSRY